MHPERRHLHAVDVDLNDLLGVLIPGRDRDVVATRSQLLCPAARHEGILNRERMARHQCTAEGWDRNTGSLPPRHETPKDCNPDIMEDASTSILSRMRGLDTDVTAAISATRAQGQTQAEGGSPRKPLQCKAAVLPSMPSSNSLGATSRTSVSIEPFHTSRSVRPQHVLRCPGLHRSTTQGRESLPARSRPVLSEARHPTFPGRVGQESARSVESCRAYS